MSETRNRQPNSNDGFAAGRRNPIGLQLAIYDNGVDEVYSTHTVPETYAGFPGVVHGGIVAALLDEVVARVSLIQDQDRFMMTAKMEVKYRQPVPTCVELQVTGKLLRLGSRIGRAEGTITLPDGTVAAEATLTLVDVPADYFERADLPALGWYVD